MASIHGIRISDIRSWLSVFRQPSFDALLNPPEKTTSGAYYVVLNPEVVLQNLDLALTWAFNIPRGWHTQWRHLSPWAIGFLKTFRITIGALTLISLFGFRRKWFLLGMAWFLIAIAPTLPLFEHFVPYYLFLPLVGFSLVIGSAVSWLHDYMGRISLTAATTVCCAPFLVLTLVCAISIRNDASANRALGRPLRSWY